MKHTTNTMRFNITLPRDIGTKLKSTKNHSATIAESLALKFAIDEKTKLDSILAKAYADSAQEDKELVAEWDSTLGDGL